MKSPLVRLIVMIVLMSAVIGGYVAWYAAIVKLSVTSASIQSEIIKKTEMASRVSSARVALSEVSGEGYALQQYFVSETDVVAFIDNLEEHAKSQGSSITVRSVSKKTKSARPALALALSVEGTFDAVVRTVGIIEYFPYDISIDDFSLGRDQDGIWHAELSLVVGSIKTTTP